MRARARVRVRARARVRIRARVRVSLRVRARVRVRVRRAQLAREGRCVRAHAPPRLLQPGHVHVPMEVGVEQEQREALIAARACEGLRLHEQVQ